jgi:hypothetical protein
MRELQENRMAAQAAGDSTRDKQLENRQQHFNLAAEALGNTQSRAHYDRYLAWYAERQASHRQASQRRAASPPRQQPAPAPAPRPESSPYRQPPPAPPAAGAPWMSLEDLFEGRDITVPVTITYDLWRRGFTVDDAGVRLSCGPGHEDLTYVFPGLGVPALITGNRGTLFVRATVADPPRGDDYSLTVRATRSQRKAGYDVQVPGNRVLSVDPGQRPGHYPCPGLGNPGRLGGPPGDLHLTIKRAKGSAGVVWLLVLVIMVGAGAWYLLHTGQTPIDVVHSLQHNGA